MMACGLPGTRSSQNWSSCLLPAAKIGWGPEAEGAGGNWTDPTVTPGGEYTTGVTTGEWWLRSEYVPPSSMYPELYPTTEDEWKASGELAAMDPDGIT